MTAVGVAAALVGDWPSGEGTCREHDHGASNSPYSCGRPDQLAVRGFRGF